MKLVSLLEENVPEVLSIANLRFGTLVQGGDMKVACGQMIFTVDSDAGNNGVCHVDGLWGVKVSEAMVRVETMRLFFQNDWVATTSPSMMASASAAFSPAESGMMSACIAWRV